VSLLLAVTPADESLMAAAKYSSQYISDRFLPDKAIDLIDEAGSRVRLRHIQLPEEARDLDKELKQVRMFDQALTEV
jgi:ATP-dependent Clp protease ATP-binding subunit ClpC